MTAEDFTSPIDILPEQDIAARVTGTAFGPADVFIQGMAEGRILCSPHAHALIRGIDTAKASALPGVLAVLTHTDCDEISDVKKSGSGRVAPVFARSALYIGDWVAAVAAETSWIADEALGLIEVDYELRPALLDPRLASAVASPLLHDNAPGNIADEAPHPLTSGHTENAIATAAFVAGFAGTASRSLRVDLQQHAAIASLNEDGRVAITTSASAFGRSIETVAARLALACGRTVRVIEPDSTAFYTLRTTDHHSVTLAADSNAKLCAIDHRVVADAGAYEGDETAAATFGHLVGALDCSNIGGGITSVYTNSAPAAGMTTENCREGNVVFQQALDCFAEKVGMDPLAFRLANLVSGDAGARMRACISGGSERFGWSGKWRGWDRDRSAGGRYLQGVGMSILTRQDARGFVGHQADFAEVEVDTETGFTVLLRHVCAFDVTGFRVLPDPVKLQASLVRGIGSALIEDFVTDPRSGAVLWNSPAPLRAPTIMDAPDLDYVLTGKLLGAETEDKHEPDWVTLADPAPAIANAVYDAAKIRIHSMPLSADKILRSLRDRSAPAPEWSRGREDLSKGETTWTA